MNTLFIYIILINIILLIVSLLWYEMPAAHKIARDGKRLSETWLESMINNMGLKKMEVIIIKSNAARAIQIGAKGKYIFITDTLIRSLENNEIKFVIAHELAHIKFRHVLKKVLIFDLCVGGGMNAAFIYQLCIKNVNYIIMDIMIWISIIVYLLIRVRIWQFFEYQADCYAAKFVDEKDIKSALLKINTILYQNYKKIHPAIQQRLAKLGGCK